MTSKASTQSLQVSAEDIKPILEESYEEDDSDGSSPPEGDDAAPSAPGVKRPRLRLAHACDRCRKRKIRCDTQQPCGPCSAAHAECTFQTPTRRTSKAKGALADPGAAGSGGLNRSTKRPHSPPREALEARLAALESMLRDVPPNVHNAYLSSLDARLGSGTGVGLKEGQSEGVGVAPEALLGGSTTDWSAIYSSWNANGGGSFPGDATLAPGLGIGSGSNRGRSKEEGVEAMAKKMEGMSFFYEDEIGQAKWQGATSGFPLLDILTASQTSRQDSVPRDLSPDIVTNPPRRSPSTSASTTSASAGAAPAERFFPDRKPRPHQTLNPEASWKVITGVIPPDLMDTLVRCYLSTSHLLWPFLHVPSFLADYANPAQWGEPGFACFIVAVCTLSSRHVDDPRVRANASDPSTAGKSYFELFKRLRDLPSADRPTLYSIQAAFLAAIYAFGLGNLSKAFALQAESITLCLDGGLHRSVDAYDHFDAVEKETRKRTFWSIYSWDKQSAALFGRPPIIHLRDCDVTEPIVVDDEDLTAEGVKEGKSNDKSRMCAFVAAIRLHVILEGVIESATQPSTFPTSPFLARASLLTRRPVATLGEEEDLLAEWTRLLPKYWSYDSETANSRDPIRITQAERLHCLEHLVKMIIYRHRFSGFVSMPASTSEDRNKHLDLCRKAMQCALTIVADHVHISQRGMMTYYGVHVIHQLAQAGRTLVAVILNCRNADFRPLVAPAIEGLRSCVGLLRRFSGRYLCGLRSADIIDEFCRICNIPIESPRVPDGTGRAPPAWLRPVRKRATPSPRASMSPAFGEDIMSAPPDLTTGGSFSSNAGLGSGATPSAQHERNGSWSKADLDALFNGYFDLSAMSPEATTAALPINPAGSTGFNSFGSPPPSHAAPGAAFGSSLGAMSNGAGGGGGGGAGAGGMFDFSMNNFDFGNAGAGGELLAGEGMDTVSDGLQGGDQGMSAATILSLMEEGTFDYGAMFTDQAPIASDFAIRP